MINLESEQSKLVTASLLILAAVALACALIYTQAVMIPFVLAIFVTYMVAPLVDFLQVRVRIPRALSVIVALLVVLALLYVVGVLLAVSARGILQNQQLYEDRIATLIQQGVSGLDQLNINLGQEELARQLQSGARELPFMAWLRNMAGRLINLVSDGFLVLIFVVFLLLGRNPHRASMGIYAEIDSKVRKYIVTKVVLSAITGLLVGTILWMLNLDLALVFGVLTFLLNFIPSLGSIIAIMVPIPVAVIQYESLWPVLWVILLPGAVQMVIGNVIEPKLMGGNLELHPITVLFALVFWGILWGPAGMLLAAPITAVLRIILARIETTRPIANLLTGRLPSEQEQQKTSPDSTAGASAASD